jgi:hypothetical protein
MGKRPSTPIMTVPAVLVEAVKSKRVISFLGTKRQRDEYKKTSGASATT